MSDNIRGLKLIHTTQNKNGKSLRTLNDSVRGLTILMDVMYSHSCCFQQVATLEASLEQQSGVISPEKDTAAGVREEIYNWWSTVDTNIHVCLPRDKNLNWRLIILYCIIPSKLISSNPWPKRV
jgi:hypothetical protein